MPVKYVQAKPTIGQGLSEYGLIAGALLLLVLPAMLLFGNSLSGLLQDWNSHLALKTAKLKPGLFASQPDSSPVVGSHTAQSPLPASASHTKTLTLTTSKGNIIHINHYPASYKESVNTIGANGTTDYLANTLARLAEELKRSGESDETGYNDLLKLANQGHRIAQIEKLVEEAAAAAKTGKEFLNKTVYLDGKAMIVDDLEDMIGFRTTRTDPTHVSDPLSYPFPKGETQKFINLYNSYLKSNPDMDPAIRALIGDLSKQIAYLSEVSNCAQVAVYLGEMAPQEFQDKIVSDTTHMDSSHICKTGGNQDNGVKCSS
jgi:hypothetical protein